MKIVRSQNRAAAGAMRGYLAGFGLLFALTLSASAESLHVAGAGSLTTAFTDLLRSFPAARKKTPEPRRDRRIGHRPKWPETRREKQNFLLAHLAIGRIEQMPGEI